MDFKKIAPWNWFKDEENTQDNPSIIRKESQYQSPVAQLHEEIDRFFERMMRSFGLDSHFFPDSLHTNNGTLLKPNVDIAATDTAYTITVEAPGVTEDNIQLELVDDTLTIRGEKKQQTESRDMDFYRIERRYGTFQRVLSLPEDADRENIDAQFKNGVLTITVPRRAQSKPRGKIINIRKGS